MLYRLLKFLKEKDNSLEINFKRWEELVLDKDNYTCFFCGQRNKKLHADHIKPCSSFPELSLDINNGKAVCKKCYKSIKKYRINNKINHIDLKKRAVELSYKYKLAHLSSTVTGIDAIYDIFAVKKANEKFVLSAGHLGLALYICLEHFHGVDAEQLLKDYGIHPKHDDRRYIYCSSGSLGCGIVIAVGIALSNKNENVHCLLTDGECYEGSIMEALSFKQEYNINNLKVYVNANGHSAYKLVDETTLSKKMLCLDKDIKIIYTNSNQLPFLNGLDAHYHIMNENDYNIAIEYLNNLKK